MPTFVPPRHAASDQSRTEPQGRSAVFHPSVRRRRADAPTTAGAPSLRRSVLPVLLASVLLALALPSRAAAQCAPTDAECLAGQPPVVWIEPADVAWSGSTPTANLTVTIHWCAPYSSLAPASRTIWLDGDSVTGSFGWQTLGNQQIGTQHCTQHAQSSATITLASGAHQLQATIGRSDAPTTVGQATASYTYTYVPPPTYGVTVAPHAGSVQRPRGAALGEAFQVTNTGNVAATFAVTALCAGSAATACAPSATTR